MCKISKNSAIIVAAGKGRRMGKNYNKQYIILGDRPIIVHTLQVFEENGLIDEIILVVGKGEVNLVKEEIIKKYNFKKISHVLEGGEERQDSVYKGLNAVNKDCDNVIIHDGARPFIEEAIIEKCINTAMETGAAIVAVPVKDTIKVVNENMDVIHTPNRDRLWAIQTPQVFRYNLLMEAYENLQNNNIKATDDAMVVEQLGHSVKIIKGSYENIKVTTPEDLILGEGILKNRSGEK